jgi:hypothetical protein
MVMAVQVLWVEIPAKNMERAAKFYSGLLATEYRVVEDGVRRVGNFDPGQEGGVGISVNETANFEPSNTGTLVYLTVDDLEAAVQRVEPLGGKIVAPKTAMGEWGFYAMFEDTEGNVLALYGST